MWLTFFIGGFILIVSGASFVYVSESLFHARILSVITAVFFLCGVAITCYGAVEVRQGKREVAQLHIAKTWCLAHGDRAQLIDEGFTCGDGYQMKDITATGFDYYDAAQLNKLEPFFRSIKQSCATDGGVSRQDIKQLTFVCRTNDTVRAYKQPS